MWSVQKEMDAIVAAKDEEIRHLSAEIQRLSQALLGQEERASERGDFIRTQCPEEMEVQVAAKDAEIRRLRQALGVQEEEEKRGGDVDLQINR